MRSLATLFFFFTALSQVAAQDTELIIPLGHTRRVVDMAVSPGQQWMASIDGSTEVKLWDYVSGRELYHLHHQQSVNAISYHPQAQWLASGDDGGQLILWSDHGLKRWTIQAHDEKIKQVRFTSGGDTLVTASAGQIGIWNAASGSQIAQWSSPVESIESISVMENYLIIGGGQGELALIHIITGEVINQQKVSEARIGSICSDQSGAFLGTDAGELIKLDWKTFGITKSAPFSLRNYRVVSVPIQNLVYACGRDANENVKVFDAKTLQALPLSFEIETDKNSEAFKFGLRAMTIAADTLLLMADYQQVIRTYDLKNKLWTSPIFKGTAAAVYDLAVNRTENQLAIASGHGSIKVIDLTGTQSDMILTGSELGTRAIDFHPVNPVIAAYGMDEQIRVVNLISREEIFTLKAKGEYSTTPITFDPTGKYILRKSSNSDFDFYQFKSKTPKNLKVKDGQQYEFSPDGRRLVFQTPSGLSIYDPISLKVIKEIPLKEIQDISISAQGLTAALLRDDQTIHIFDKDYQKTSTLTIPVEGHSDKIYWSPDGKYLIGIRNSTKRGESGPDFSIKIIDVRDGQVTSTLKGHAGFTNSIAFVNGHLLSSAVDGKINIWDLNNAQNPLKGSVVPLDDDQYVITTPKGLFDATPRAMDQLHYVKGGKIVALSQMKSAYYEPHLLSKLLGLNAEPVRTSADLSGVSLYPELSLDHPLKNNGKLGINLSNSGGGIGRVIIMINGKEVSSDVRAASVTNEASVEIDYDITNHPFLYNDRVNKVSIKAYNSDGTLSSEEKSLYIFGEEKNTVTPRLFAIIAGSSDYAGEALDLKYAAKDATDLANAIGLSAQEYLGAENTHITLLTTDQEEAFWPTKENIKSAFESYSKQAKANDVLLVYLSGHGVNQGGENSDFYYLTCTAESGDMNNSLTRENSAIASSEFTEYIKSVSALKQILIIDACHSGRLASSLATSRSAMSSTQIRALERMKDRTGLFVLAGSAADAVSYETTLFGQGLLTYSLLFGMKGAALHEDGFVDVMDLFQFAANKVPELAEEIGGIQRPEIRMPEDGKSFDIGKLSESSREKIAIKAPKPVYVHSRFQDESSIYDRLGVSDLMDSKLVELSKSKDAPIVFVDDKSFSGATIISGRYTESGDLIRARVSLIKKGTEPKEVNLEAVNIDQLTEQIVELLKVD
ncbi:caspase family protein [Marinoscillum luteum]|uniref:Caspase family protein n=1 Tax=Marinoscillum luteum TaxID=861051 RepID=A0ABW7N3Y2_9BACT